MDWCEFWLVNQRRKSGLKAGQTWYSTTSVEVLYTSTTWSTPHMWKEMYVKGKMHKELSSLEWSQSRLITPQH